METSEIKQRTNNATKWSFVTEIAARCIFPIINMILARLLTPEAFGVVATITMITSFADIFTDAGFQKYLVQHDFETEELDKNTNVAFWTNLGISIFLWGIIFLFSENIAVMVGNKGMKNVIIIASLTLPLTSFSSIQMARYKRDFDFKSLFYVRLVTMLVPFFITVPLAIITHSYWALICGTLVVNLLNAVVLTYRSKWKPKFYYSFKLLKKMFSFSWWILLESISIWLTVYIGTFTVGLFLTNYYVGIYKTSMSTVNQINELITGATSMPLFVALSRLKHDKQNLFKTYREYIQAIGVLTIPMGIGIWLYRDLITQILLGNQWTEASEFIGLWGLMSAFSLVLGTYCNGLFNAIGKTYLSFIAQMLHLVVLIPVVIWSSKKGYNVLYIARSLMRIELIVVELILLKKCLHFPVIKLLKDMIPSIICTLIMTCFAMLLQQISSHIIWRIASIFGCILIYFISMRILYKKIIKNCFETFGIRIETILQKRV